MASGLIGLLDDVAALAKAAAASIDDIGTVAARSSLKTAGVVVDDTAVTPAYVHGLAAERELPIIRRIALGSLRNKIAVILPGALVLSALLPAAVEVILLFGGAYLAYEGAHKVHQRVARHDASGPASPVVAGPTAVSPTPVSASEGDQAETPVHEAQVDEEQIDEEQIVRSALRTDLILSTEIMVIALKEVLQEGLLARAAILAIVAVLVTAGVYGVVALLVKADDVGLHLATRSGSRTRAVGTAIVRGMPRVLAALTVIGTVAMLWVGGHILLAGAAELGWHTPLDLAHDAGQRAGDVPVVGGVLAWLVETTIATVVGLVVGAAVAVVVGLMRRRRRS